MFELVVLALAVWRVTHLLVNEDGPLRMFDRLRGVAIRLGMDELVSCVYCTSVWVGVAAVIAMELARHVTLLIAYGLALSALSIAFHFTLEFVRSIEVHNHE